MIFSVVTYRHPSDGYYCLLRYVRDPEGERVRGDGRYRKLDFQDAVKFIEESRPEYGGGMPHRVPQSALKLILRPKKGLKRILDEGRQDIVRIVEGLVDEGAMLNDLGVTGSHLAGLDRPSSDIDLVAYGVRGFETARKALSRAIENGKLNEPNDEVWRKIYSKRSPELSFKEFVFHEKRKNNRGVIDGRYFDLLFTRDWDEIKDIPKWGEGKKKMRIEARVTGDRFCFDNPAIYEVEHQTVDKVLSYTHTYVGQAFEGEVLQAEGWVVEAGDETLLVVGTTRKARGEWIRSLTAFGNRDFE